MRVLITSDLHFDVSGAEPIRRLVAGMDRENPDLVVVAGDVGNPSPLFSQCLAAFSILKCPVAVLPGNRDLHGSAGETSILLLEEVLPTLCRELGCHWLERGPLRLAGGIAVVGSIAWYDGDATGPMAPPRAVDWEYTDPDFAAHCRGRMVQRLAALEADSAVDRVLVVTHVPCFPSQLERHNDDPAWSAAGGFYAHLALGEAIRPFAKVRWVVSGHTHLGMNGVEERPNGEPIATAVVGSDYGKPGWVTLELDE